MNRMMTGALMVGAALAAAGCNRGDKAANQANVAAPNASAGVTNAAQPAAPAATAQEGEVRAFLDQVYASYARDGLDSLPWAQTFEPQMAAALDTEEGAPNVDPYTGAQDSSPFRPTYENIRINGDRAEATARFTSMNAPTEINYQLMRTPAGWRIYDIRTAQQPSLRAVTLRPAG